jgi:cytochrome c peroxidase
MNHNATTLSCSLLSAALLSLAFAAPAQAANPCAAKAPGAAQNACAAKNPCAAKLSPAAQKIIQRPANYQPYKGDPAELAKLGEQLFNDPKLSTNGTACASCHRNGAAFKASFGQPFPHRVAMAAQAYGMQQVHLDEAIQMCMIGPMANRPLAWNSKELAGLVAYIGSLQKNFIPAGGQ